MAGGALNFDGSSTQVTLPAAAFASINKQITIALWVYGDNSLPQNQILFYAEDGSGNRVLNVNLPWGDSQVYWDAGNSKTGSYDRISKAASASDFKGRWNHWVFTKNAKSGEMKIYLNGALWTSGTGKIKTMAGITRVTLGSQNGAAFYHGGIDYVRLFASALTDRQVATLYASYVASKVAPKK
jgi:hypothetical protein